MPEDSQRRSQAIAQILPQNNLPETAIDTALIRLVTARICLGMFDPAELMPYSKIQKSELDSAAHCALARQMANESMALLKNDGTLPLKSVKRIATVGPLADQTVVLSGNYNGSPTHTVSVLEVMKAEFPDAKINYVPGTQFLCNHGDPVPASEICLNFEKRLCSLAKLTLAVRARTRHDSSVLANNFVTTDNFITKVA